MGDASHKRPLEDGEEPGAKKIATFTPGPGMAAIGNMNNPPGTLSETMQLPDDLVGLIIGRGGENIMRMQRETGCRIQITQSVPGTKDRPCTLSGTPEQIEICRNMLLEIVARSEAGGGVGGGGGGPNMGGPNMGPGPGMQGMGGPHGIPAGGMGEGGEKNIVLSIPADKCGLIIGKGGETIKMLQQNLGVRMLLIQETTENIGTSKPLKISGLPVNVDNAANAIHQMMAQRDKQIAEQQGMNPPGTGGGEVQVIPVPKPAVGVVIGKGGDMINQIQNVTQTRIQFKPDDAHMPERLCTITGGKEGVEAAVQRVQEIIQNVQERDASGGGGGGPRNMGGPRGMGGNFGQWDGPGMMRGGPVATEHHLVPANRTGLVIGKGGETIKQINMQSGARAEIQKNPPPGSDLNYKTFIIKGTPEQIKICRQLIQEKVDGNSGGMSGGSMRGPPQQTPPPGNFMPQQQFNPLSSGANFVPPQNHLQGPPQIQPAPQIQQQPWGGQFPQWTPPGGAAPTAAAPAISQHNGVDPTKVAPAAAAATPWQQPFLQIYGQQAQPSVQAPAATAAAPVAAAATASAAAVPDYSKQWDEYLKRTGAVQAAAAAAAAAASAGATPTPTLQQPVAVAPAAVAAPAAAAAAAAQPATTQADYSAAWAEYYRQYYELQGQQYAAAVAAAGQAPAQP